MQRNCKDNKKQSCSTGKYTDHKSIGYKPSQVRNQRSLLLFERHFLKLRTSILSPRLFLTPQDPTNSISILTDAVRYRLGSLIIWFALSGLGCINLAEWWGRFSVVLCFELVSAGRFLWFWPNEFPLKERKLSYSKRPPGSRLMIPVCQSDNSILMAHCFFPLYLLCMFTCGALGLILNL